MIKSMAWMINEVDENCLARHIDPSVPGLFPKNKRGDWLLSAEEWEHLHHQTFGCAYRKIPEYLQPVLQYNGEIYVQDA